MLRVWVLATALAAASPATAQTERAVDAARVFGLLQGFEALPGASRTHLQVQVLITREDGAALTTPVFFEREGVRRALPLDREGAVIDPPAGAEIDGARVIVQTSEGRLSASVRLEPVLTLGQEIAMSEVAAALSQAQAAIAAADPATGLGNLRVTTVLFAAPADAAAFARFSNGGQRPLARTPRGFAVTPAELTGATAIVFTTPPSAATFG